jgi:spore maturation protein CgeB
MKLLLVGKPWRGRWLDYVHAACAELGHDARIFHTTGNGRAERWFRSAARRTVPALWTRHWRRALGNVLEAFRPDLVLVVSALVPEDMLSFLSERRRGRKLFCWFGDNPARRPHLFDRIDHGFVTDSAHLAALTAAAVTNASYLSFAASPAHHFPDPGPGDAHDVVFVADWAPEREALVAPLAGLDLGLYGPGWRRAAPAVAARARDRFLDLPEWRRLYGNAVLSLNVHQRVCDSGTNMRTYEIAACEGCPVVEWKDDLTRDFTPGEDLVTFRDAADLTDTVESLLADRPRARKVAEAARARVLAEHTYVHRVRHILAHA